VRHPDRSFACAVHRCSCCIVFGRVGGHICHFHGPNVMHHENAKPIDILDQCYATSSQARACLPTNATPFLRRARWHSGTLRRLALILIPIHLTSFVHQHCLHTPSSIDFPPFSTDLTTPVNQWNPNIAALVPSKSLQFATNGYVQTVCTAIASSL
jgi:hypothetical protein